MPGSVTSTVTGPAGRELAQDRPLNELFDLIMDLSIHAVKAERGVLMTYENGELVPRGIHGDGFRVSKAVRDKVINEKASILIRDEVFMSIPVRVSLFLSGR